MQPVRIANTRRHVFSRQSTTIWEQLSTKKKERSRLPEWRKDRLSAGECERRHAGVVYFWHSEGWTRNEALMEAVVKKARTTEHPWFVACVANVDPEDFNKSLLCKNNCMAN